MHKKKQDLTQEDVAKFENEIELVKVHFQTSPFCRVTGVCKRYVPWEMLFTLK